MIDVKSIAGLSKAIPNVAGMDGKYLCIFPTKSWSHYFSYFMLKNRRWPNNVKIFLLTFMNCQVLTSPYVVYLPIYSFIFDLVCCNKIISCDQFNSPIVGKLKYDWKELQSIAMIANSIIDMTGQIRLIFLVWDLTNCLAYFLKSNCFITSTNKGNFQMTYMNKYDSMWILSSYYSFWDTNIFTWSQLPWFYFY